jgi:protein-tyrosine-phosphatase/predicted ATP-grasp superfamily ATP-dependent carboligase
MVGMSAQEAKVILVTDAECGSALACIRSLGRAGFHVCAVGSARSPAAAASRYVKRYFQTESPWYDGATFLSQLSQISKQVAADYVLPISEAAIFFISRDGLAAENGAEILLANDDLLTLGQSKISTFQRALETTSDVVDGFVLAPGDDRSAFPGIDFPVIIRTDNHLDEDGRYKKGEAWIVKSRSDWESILREQKSTGQRILVQKYIAGQGSGCFLLLWNGEIVCWHSHRRLAEIPWQGGVSARRRLEFDDDLLARSHKLLKGLNPSGIAMIEFRSPHLDAQSPSQNGPFIVEVNARPWGSMALSAHANIPFVPLWIELVKESKGESTGKLKLQRPPRQPKKIVCTSIYPGEFQHLWSVFRSVLKSELTIKDGLHFLNKSFQTILHPGTYFDYFWRDDPSPALASLISALALLHARLILRLQTLLFQCVLAVHRRLGRLAAWLTPGISNDPKGKVVVVCYGNRCRSPFFEMLIRDPLKTKGISVSSRGLKVSERYVPLRFHEVFRFYGVDPSTHSASQISIRDIEDADKILVMEWRHILLLAKRFGWKHVLKCSLLDLAGNTRQEVADPFLLSPIEAARVFADLHERAQNYSARITSCLNSHRSEEALKTGNPTAGQ